MNAPLRATITTSNQYLPESFYPIDPRNQSQQLYAASMNAATACAEIEQVMQAICHQPEDRCLT